MPILLEEQATLLHYAIQYKDAQGSPISYLSINSKNASLIITATALDGSVNVSGIKITIPTGGGGSDLTSTLTTENVVVPTNWGLDQDVDSFIFSHENPRITNSITFIFNQIDVNDTVGGAPLAITERAEDGTIRTTTLYANKFPESFHLSDLAVNPPIVHFGGSTTVSWEGSPDATYTLGYGEYTSIPIDGNGSYSYVAENLEENPTIFYVTAKMLNSDDTSHPLTAQKQTSVTVTNAGSYLSPNITSCLPGEPITLSWQIADADPNTAGTIRNNYDTTSIEIAADNLERGSKTIEPQAPVPSLIYSMVYYKDGLIRSVEAAPISILPSVINVDSLVQCIVCTPSGEFVYAAEKGSNTVSVIDTLINKVVDSISLPKGNINFDSVSVGITITPDGKFVYVSFGDTVNKEINIYVIDTSTNKASKYISLKEYFGGGIVITPDGKFIYLEVIHQDGNIVSVINTSTKKVVSQIPLEYGAHSIAITSDRNSAYGVSNSSNIVSVINTSTNKVDKYIYVPIEGKAEPGNRSGIAIYGNFAYGVFGSLDAKNNIWVINTLTNEVVSQISLGDYSAGSIAITSDGKYAYVSSTKGKTIQVIDISKNKPTEDPASLLSLNIPTPTCLVGEPITLSWQIAGSGPNTNGRICNSYDTSSIEISEDNLKKGSKTINTPEKSISSLIYAMVYSRNEQIRSVTATSIQSLPSIINNVDSLAQRLVFTPDGKFVYALGSDSNIISVIDTSTNTVVQSIPLSPSVKDGSYVGIVITPDGKFVYAARGNSDGNIYVIDTSKNTVVDHISLQHFFGGIAITPDGKFVYALSNVGNGSAIYFSVIDTSTKKVKDINRPVKNGLLLPYDIAITPDGKFVYIADLFFIYAFNTSTNKDFPIEVKSGGCMMFFIVITPDGKFAYVGGGYYSNIIYVIDVLKNKIVKVIRLTEEGLFNWDDSHPDSSQRIPRMSGAVTPDGKFVYAVFGFADANHNIFVIDTKTNEVCNKIQLQCFADSIAITPDGRYAYVSSTESRTIHVIDTSKYENIK